MYRDHRDPLYYDPAASGRILVPVTDVEALPQEKRAIVESVPAEDRGEILKEEEYARLGYGLSAGLGDGRPHGGAQGADLKENLTKLVEGDQVAAAAKRKDLKL